MTQREFYENWERDLERTKENYQNAIKKIDWRLEEVRLNLISIIKDEEMKAQEKKLN